MECGLQFPDLKTAYGLSMWLSQIFENTKDKVFGLANLAKWHEKVRQVSKLSILFPGPVTFA